MLQNVNALESLTNDQGQMTNDDLQQLAIFAPTYLLNHIIPKRFYETHIISDKLELYESFYRLKKIPDFSQKSGISALEQCLRQAKPTLLYN